MNEQPGPGHMVMAPRHSRGDAGWVLARPLRQPRPGTTTTPQQSQHERNLPPLPMIRRRLTASSSFVLAAARLRALQLDPSRTAT